MLAGHKPKNRHQQQQSGKHGEKEVKGQLSCTPEGVIVLGIHRSPEPLSELDHR
jgi:hypothetical protein